MKQAGVHWLGQLSRPRYLAGQLPASISYRLQKAYRTNAGRDYGELTTRGDIVWAFSIVEHDEIDRINILRATHQAMRRAVAALAIVPQHALIDGLPVTPFSRASNGPCWRGWREFFHRGCQCHREGYAGPDHGRNGLPLSGLQFFSTQRLWNARTS